MRHLPPKRNMSIESRSGKRRRTFLSLSGKEPGLCERPRELAASPGVAVAVVFGAQTRGADRSHHREELLEGHMEIEKAALAKHPTVIVEDLGGNHARQPRQARNHREWARAAG